MRSNTKRTIEQNSCLQDGRQEAKEMRKPNWLPHFFRQKERCEVIQNKRKYARKDKTKENVRSNSEGAKFSSQKEKCEVIQKEQ